MIAAPTLWRLPAPAVVSPKPISGLWAVFLSFLLPFVPRLVGPHITRAGWGAALLIPVLHGLILVPLFALLSGAFERGSPPDVLEMALERFSLLSLLDAAGLLDHDAIWPILLLIPSLMIYSVALTTPLSWALHGVGERRRILLARSVKFGLWNTSSIIWLVLVWLYFVSKEGTATIWCLIAILHLTIVARLGADYAGPREGPRWEPFEPACERCRYNLTGIAIDGNCPECGRAVRDSHPDHRTPPAFATAQGWQRVPGFLKTFRASLFDRSFAKHLSLWRARSASDTFMVMVCVLCGLVTVGLIALLRLWHDGRDSALLRIVGLGPDGGWWLGGLVVGIACYLMGVGERFTQSIFFGRRSVPNAVLLNYLYGWVLLTLTLGGVGLVAADMALRQTNNGLPLIELPVIGLISADIWIYLGGTTLLVLPVLIAGVLQVFRQIREVRYARG